MAVRCAGGPLAEAACPGVGEAVRADSIGRDGAGRGAGAADAYGERSADGGFDIVVAGRVGASVVRIGELGVACGY